MKNGSKIWPSVSSSIPSPASRTVSVTYRPGSIEPSPISSTSTFAVSIGALPPVGIASRALTTRFITTWWSWPGSASIGPRAGSSCGRQDDVLADQRTQHRLHLDDDPVQVQELGLQHLLAAEREQLPGEQRGAVGRLLDLVQVDAQRRAVLGVLEREAV